MYLCFSIQLSLSVSTSFLKSLYTLYSRGRGCQRVTVPHRLWAWSPNKLIFFKNIKTGIQYKYNLWASPSRLIQKASAIFSFKNLTVLTYYLSFHKIVFKILKIKKYTLYNYTVYCFIGAYLQCIQPYLFLSVHIFFKARIFFFSAHDNQLFYTVV